MEKTWTLLLGPCLLLRWSVLISPTPSGLTSVANHLYAESAKVSAQGF